MPLSLLDAVCDEISNRSTSASTDLGIVVIFVMLLLLSLLLLLLMLFLMLGHAWVRGECSKRKASSRALSRYHLAGGFDRLFFMSILP